MAVILQYYSMPSWEQAAMRFPNCQLLRLILYVYCCMCQLLYGNTWKWLSVKQLAAGGEQTFSDLNKARGKNINY